MLYVRVRYHGGDIKQATGIKVNVEKWNRRREKPSTLALAERIRLAIDGILDERGDISSEEVRAAITENMREHRRSMLLRSAIRPVKMTLSRYVGMYLADIEEGRRLNYRRKPFCASTVKSIKWAMKVFADYQTARGCEIDFDDVDLAFLDDYRFYLEDERKFRKNTASKCVKELKSIMAVAKFEQYTDNTFFDNARYGIGREEVSSIALTEEELTRLMLVDISGMPVKAQLARDLFIAGVCSCQRFSDFCKIGKENLEILEADGEKVWMLHFRQQKTDAEVAIPCRPELKAILRKYNFTIPTMTLQVLNRHIKAIARAAGINKPEKVTETIGGKKRTVWVPRWKMVSSHTARRTGATLMYYKGVDVYDIMRITGHRSPEMLRKYIHAEPVDTVRKLHNTPFFRGE